MAGDPMTGKLVAGANDLIDEPCIPAPEPRAASLGCVRGGRGPTLSGTASGGITYSSRIRSLTVNAEHPNRHRHRDVAGAPALPVLQQRVDRAVCRLVHAQLTPREGGLLARTRTSVRSASARRPTGSASAVRKAAIGDLDAAPLLSPPVASGSRECFA